MRFIPAIKKHFKQNLTDLVVFLSNYTKTKK